MPGPGKGRYTDYVGLPIPGSTSKYNRLHKLFNNNPMTSDKGENRGLFYGSTDKANQSSNSNAAKVTVANYINRALQDIPNAELSDQGSLLTYFNGTPTDPIPNTAELDVTSGIKGPPANPYMPDLSSPGALENGKTNFDKENDELVKISPTAYKPDLVVAPETIDDKFALNTVSPHISSDVTGLVSIGAELTMGSSKKTAI